MNFRINQVFCPSVAFPRESTQKEEKGFGHAFHTKRNAIDKTKDVLVLPKILQSDPFPIFAKTQNKSQPETWSDSFAHSNKKRSEEIEKEGKKMVGQFFLIVQTFVELLVGEDGISQKFVLFANLSDMNSTQLSKKNCQNIETKLNFREEGLFSCNDTKESHNFTKTIKVF